MTSQSDDPKDLPPREKRPQERGERIEGVIIGGVRGEPWRGKRPTIDHQIAAAKELLNRGWGRGPDADDGETRTFTLIVKPGDDF